MQGAAIFSAAAVLAGGFDVKAAEIINLANGAPIEVAWASLTQIDQATPEPTPINEVVDQAKGIIGSPEQFSGDDFLAYVESSLIPDSEKELLHSLVEDTKSLGLALADNGWDQPLIDVQKSMQANVQVTKVRGGVLVNGFVTNSSELTKNSEKIEPGSFLVGYQIGSELKVDGISANQGQKLIFVPSVSADGTSQSKVALISVLEDGQGLVTDGIAVFDPSLGQVVMEPAARMLADTTNNPTNLMEFPATQFGSAAGTELSKLIKNTSSLQFAGNNKPDNLDSNTVNISSQEINITAKPIISGVPWGFQDINNPILKTVPGFERLAAEDAQDGHTFHAYSVFVPETGVEVRKHGNIVTWVVSLPELDESGKIIKISELEVAVQDNEPPYCKFNTLMTANVSKYGMNAFVSQQSQAFGKEHVFVPGKSLIIKQRQDYILDGNKNAFAMHCPELSKLIIDSNEGIVYPSMIFFSDK